MHKFSLLCFISFFLLSACDSGDIYTDNSATDNTIDINVSGSFRFSDIAAFPTNYKIALATFNSSSTKPSSKIIIDNPEVEDSLINVTLQSIPKGTSKINLCLLDAQGTDSIYSFYSYPIVSTPSSDINLPSQNISLSSFGRLQSQLFSQCIQCHGGGTIASAGLYLTRDKSYAQLVNHIAKNSTAKNRVTPFSVSNSFIYDVLTKTEAVSYNHTDISTLKQDDIQLIRAWIITGAKNN